MISSPSSRRGTTSSYRQVQSSLGAGFDTNGKPSPKSGGSGMSTGAWVATILLLVLVVGTLAASIVAAVFADNARDAARDVRRGQRIEQAGPNGGPLLSLEQVREEQKGNALAYEITEESVAFLPGLYIGEELDREFVGDSFRQKKFTPIGTDTDDDSFSLVQKRLRHKFEQLDESRMDPQRYAKLDVHTRYGWSPYDNLPAVCKAFDKFVTVPSFTIYPTTIAYFWNGVFGGRSPSENPGFDSQRISKVMDTESDVEKMVHVLEENARVFYETVVVDGFVEQLRALGDANGLVMPLSTAESAINNIIFVQSFFFTRFFVDFYILFPRGLALTPSQSDRVDAAIERVNATADIFIDDLLTLPLVDDSFPSSLYASNNLVETCVRPQLDSNLIEDERTMFYDLLAEYDVARDRLNTIMEAEVPDWQGHTGFYKHVQYRGQEYNVTSLWYDSADCVPDPVTGFSVVTQKYHDAARKTSEQLHRFSNVVSQSWPAMTRFRGGTAGCDAGGLANGNVFIDIAQDRFDRRGSAFVAFEPIFTRNEADLIFLHEWVHTVQANHEWKDGNRHDYVRRLDGLFSGFDYRTAAEGFATFVERTGAREIGFYDETDLIQQASYEALHIHLRLEAPIITLAAQLGIWTPEEAAEWRWNNSLFIRAIVSGPEDLVSTGQYLATVPMSLTTTTYTNGYHWWTQRMQRAKDRCGDAFNFRHFFQQGVSPLAVGSVVAQQAQVDRFIEEGCRLRTTEWGDLDGPTVV